RETNERGLLGWRVYIDTNANGQFDNGEFSSLTSESGVYNFFKLPPGNYTIREVSPAEWTQTTLASTLNVTLSPTNDLTDINIGNQRPSVIVSTFGPMGSEFQVNTRTQSFQNDPRVAVDSNGNFVVV